jgi:ferredoxin-NADP reductase
MTMLARPLPARRLPAPALNPRPPAAPPALNATIVTRIGCGATAGLFTLELDERLDGYRAGQYVALGIDLDGRLLQRPYSIVALAGRRLELLIRRVEGGALSPRLWDLRRGSRVRVGPPRGLFMLGAGDERRLLVGAGTGIAPLLAMLDASARAGDGVPATLIHGVSYASELIFSRRIDGWRAAGLELDYRPTVSRSTDPANRAWAGRLGRAETQLQAVLAGGDLDRKALTAYLCGNPPMVDACTGVLKQAGLPEAAIRVERF